MTHKVHIPRWSSGGWSYNQRQAHIKPQSKHSLLLFWVIRIAKVEVGRKTTNCFWDGAHARFDKNVGKSSATCVETAKPHAFRKLTRGICLHLFIHLSHSDVRSIIAVYYAIIFRLSDLQGAHEIPRWLKTRRWVPSLTWNAARFKFIAVPTECPMSRRYFVSKRRKQKKVVCFWRSRVFVHHRNDGSYTAMGGVVASNSTFLYFLSSLWLLSELFKKLYVINCLELGSLRTHRRLMIFLPLGSRRRLGSLLLLLALSSEMIYTSLVARMHKSCSKFNSSVQAKRPKLPRPLVCAKLLELQILVTNCVHCFLRMFRLLTTFTIDNTHISVPCTKFPRLKQSWLLGHHSHYLTADEHATT